MRILKEESIKFECKNCRSIIEGFSREFKESNVKPPTFSARCPSCFSITPVYPTNSNGWDALLASVYTRY